MRSTRSAANEMADLMAYDDLCAQIWADKRFPGGTREVALAFAWVMFRDPKRAETRSMDVVRPLLGRDAIGHWRMKRLLAEDAPRYWESGPGDPALCEGPRLRPYRPRRPKVDPSVTRIHEPMFHDGRGGTWPLSQIGDCSEPSATCGAHGSIRVREWDLATGHVRADHWFCRRHEEHADRVRAQIEAAGERPEPVPNRGGLLPCYFRADWEGIYAWAADSLWRAPSYGVCADDWPTAAHQVVPKRPRLGLVVSL